MSNSLSISATLVVRMMANAGMGENAILDTFAKLTPSSTFDGMKYYNATKVSRAIKRYSVKG